MMVKHVTSASTMLVPVTLLSILFINVAAVKVVLPLGTLQGNERNTVSQRKYYAFYGVPYAKPPIGQYRFKEPVPVEPWTGTYVANTVVRCLQYGLVPDADNNSIMGDEDCLHLHIYTPRLESTAKLDVIFYIHGGAFMFNYAGSYKADYLLDKDVVLVTVNYRLGPLGFLSTGSKVVPGNNGIRDQLSALKWVKSYIEYFGGNKDSITLIGNSAGGASVHLHSLTPKSSQLFHRAFPQSGTMLNPWVLMEKPAEKFLKVATLVGCNDVINPRDQQEIVNCLRTRPGKQIVATVKEFQPFLYNPFSPFGVVVDGEWSSDPVLPKHPYILTKQAQSSPKPFLFSHTNAEGLFPMGFFYSDRLLDEIDSKWNQLLPHILDYNQTVSPKSLDAVSRKIRQKYLGTAKLTKDNFNDFVRLGSDRIFLHGIQKTAKLHAAISKAPVYFYQFNYRGAQSLSDFFSGTNIDFGASHADDTGYFLKRSGSFEFGGTEQDRKVVNLMVNLVTSFAKTGKPNVGKLDWPELNKNSNGNITRLVIKSGSAVEIDSSDYAGLEDFWDSLPIQENEQLFHSVNSKIEL